MSEAAGNFGERLRLVWNQMRARGVNLTTAQLADAEALALAHMTSDPFPGGMDSLRRMIGGVFAKNDADRATYDGLWASMIAPSTEPRADSLEPPPSEETSTPSPRPPGWRRWLAAARAHSADAVAALQSAAAAALVLAALALAARPDPPGPVPDGSFTLQTPPFPSLALVAESQVIALRWLDTAPPPWWDIARSLAIALPIAVAMLALARRAFQDARNNRIFHRDIDERLEAYMPSWRSISLFDGPSTRTLGRNLRRAADDPTAPLDTRRTAEATANRAGAFTPVFTARATTGTPFLIQRLDDNDHLAALFSHAVRRLQGAGAEVVPVYFRNHISHLSRETGQGAALAELADGRHHTLMVVGPPEAVLGPEGAAPGPALRRTLGGWARRILFNTRRVRDWSDAEDRALRSGFDVAPATTPSLRTAADRLFSRGRDGVAYGIRRLSS